MRNPSRCGVMSVIVFASACVAHAADVPPPFSLAVTPTASYAFDADLGDDTTVNVTRAGVWIDPAFMLGQAVRVSLNTGVEYSHYDFGGFDNFAASGGAGVNAGGDVPDDFLQIVLRPTAAVFFSENFGLYGGPVIVFGGEADVDLEDAVAYGGLIGFNWQVRPGLWVGAGVVATSQLADDALVLPLVNLSWQIDDRWSLEASGLSGRLGYRFAPAWEVSLNAAYEFREYRLGDDATVPGGVLTDQSVPVSLGLDWTPRDGVTVGLFGGAVLWRDVELFDESDNSLADDTADITGYFGVRGELAF